MSKSQSARVELAKRLSPRMFGALGDPNRVALFVHLCRCGKPCPVGEMTCCCPVDLSVVSRHLARLREAGLVRAERAGREVRYSVDHETLAAHFRAIGDAIAGCGKCCGGRGG
jgi:ArsR family transcriptional regulator